MRRSFYFPIRLSTFIALLCPMFVLSFGTNALFAANQAKRPNVVFVMTDDK